MTSQQETDIVRNSIRCQRCGTNVESTHRHDYRTCECGANAVDGGHDYLRRMGSSYEDTSIIAPDEPRTHQLEHSEEWIVNTHHSVLCAGRPCTIHNRTDHPLRTWRQAWVNNRIMRMCPHQMAHKDPDETGRKQCVRCDQCCKEA